ncbi:MAG: Flp family type IVb pilin [Planctomycetes bacterium]|nr:Flp family type IVb pilin [Planctomycetota bacterium]
MLKLRRRRRGQGMTEYIIIVGLIAILLIAAVNTFSGTLSEAFDSAGKNIKTKVTAKMK